MYSVKQTLIHDNLSTLDSEKYHISKQNCLRFATMKRKTFDTFEGNITF